MRWLLLMALGCGGGEDSAPPPGGGAPAGTTTATGTPGGTALPTPTWTMVLLDDVSTGIGGDQHHPTHARRDDGSTLVLWDQEDAVVGHVVAVRAFGPDGVALAETTVLADVGGQYSRPDAGPVHDGYVAVWNTRLDVFVGKVDWSGTEVGVEQTANVERGVDPDKGQPDLAVLADGTVVIVYHFSDPYAPIVSTYYSRRYDADLSPLTAETAIATSEQVGSPPDVAPLADGGYLVAWSTRDEVAGTLNLSFYDVNGVEQQTFRADQSGPTETPSRPNIAVAEDGTIALAWRVQTNDGVGVGAYGRLFEADGTPRTDSFVFPQSSQRGTVSAGPGVFLFTWEPPVSSHIKAQLVDARTGLALEEPWEPFPGDGAQERSQSSFWELPDGTWSVVFTADRGPTGSRTLLRAIWNLDLVAP